MNLKNEKGVKLGFTLAEALIVLAIVGVIAAFVIPLVITKSNTVQLVSALQKINNTFTNMANQAQTKENMQDWNFNSTTEEFVKEYVLPNVNVAQDCGMTGAGCFAENYTASNTGTAKVDNDYYKLVLTDGTAMAVKLTPGCTNDNPSVCVDFIVDVNSVNNPNKWGKDLFQYQILGNLSAVIPYGSFDRYDADLKKWVFAEENDASSKCLTSDERYCALKIINDGWEMNY